MLYNFDLVHWLNLSFARYPKITIYAFALTIGILLWGSSHVRNLLHDTREHPPT